MVIGIYKRMQNIIFSVIFRRLGCRRSDNCLSRTTKIGKPGVGDGKRSDLEKLLHSGSHRQDIKKCCQGGHHRIHLERNSWRPRTGHRKISKQDIGKISNRTWARFPKRTSAKSPNRTSEDFEPQSKQQRECHLRELLSCRGDDEVIPTTGEFFRMKQRTILKNSPDVTGWRTQAKTWDGTQSHSFQNTIWQSPAPVFHIIINDTFSQSLFDTKAVSPAVIDNRQDSSSQTNYPAVGMTSSSRRQESSYTATIGLGIDLRIV